MRKALKVAKEVQKAGGLMVEVDWERRRLLKAMGGLVGAVVLLGINPQWARSKVKSDKVIASDRKLRGLSPLGQIGLLSSKDIPISDKTKVLAETTNKHGIVNVLQKHSSSLILDKAIVSRYVAELYDYMPYEISHDPNILISVVIPTEDDGVLVYYEVSRSIKRMRTFAAIYRHDTKETLKLVAASINGHEPQPLADDAGGANMCGGCINYVSGPWKYATRLCTHLNWGCMINCGYFACGGAATACVGCIRTGEGCGRCFWAAMGCPICLATCCDQFQPICADCGPIDVGP